MTSGYVFESISQSLWSALGRRPRIRGSRRHNYFTLGYAEGGSSLLKADSVSAWSERSLVRSISLFSLCHMNKQYIVTLLVDSCIWSWTLHTCRCSVRISLTVAKQNKNSEYQVNKNKYRTGRIVTVCFFLPTFCLNVSLPFFMSLLFVIWFASIVDWVQWLVQFWFFFMFPQPRLALPCITCTFSLLFIFFLFSSHSTCLLWLLDLVFGISFSVLLITYVSVSHKLLSAHSFFNYL